MESRKTSKSYSPEVRERAVRSIRETRRGSARTKLARLVRQVEGEEMRRPLDAADHHASLAEVGLGLGVAGRVVQRHEHRSPAPPMTPGCSPSWCSRLQTRARRAPARTPAWRCGAASVLAEIIPQPLLDVLGEPVQLRPPDRCGSPVSRRHREAQHCPTSAPLRQKGAFHEGRISSSSCPRSEDETEMRAGEEAG